MKKKSVPKWASRPFREFFQRVEDLRNLVSLSVQGISGLQGLPTVLQALADLEEDQNPEEVSQEEDRIRVAKISSALAAREFKRGFPLLYSQATVSLWAMLEDFIRSYLTTWLRRKPTARRTKDVQKITIRLAEFTELTPEERYEYIVSELELAQKVGRKKGVGRFEPVLQVFDLAGSIDRQTQRDMFELSCFRHALAHGRHRVDRKLSNECRWLRLRTGKPLAITRDQFVRFNTAVANYTITLMDRVAHTYGIDLKERMRQRQKRKSAS